MWLIFSFGMVVESLKEFRRLVTPIDDRELERKHSTFVDGLRRNHKLRYVLPQTNHEFFTNTCPTQVRVNERKAAYSTFVTLFVDGF